MIYGTPSYRLDDDQTDLIGIRTLTQSLLWQPSRWPMSQAEFDSEIPPPPAVSGGVILLGRQTRRQGGALRTSWTFEGIDGDGKSVTFKDRVHSLDYGFDPGFATVDVKLHPLFTKLQKDYEGTVMPDGRVYWPPTTTSAQGSGSGARQGNEKAKPNPMFGREDFLRIEGTYRFRYAAFNLGTAQSGLEQIFTSGQLPGVPPNFPGRDWLKAGSPYDRRGPVYDITEIYWLSGPGGWPKPLYSGGKSTGGGSGLTTGGLDTGTL